MDFTIQEELWFGDFADESAEQKAEKSFVATAGKIYGLRPFPKSAQRLIALATDPNVNLPEMQRVIESDPSLASRTLQVVNSAAYSLQVRCTSIPHAVRLLGPKTIRELAAALAVYTVFEGTDETATRFRDHGTAVGSLARHLATRCGFPSDDVYTCGLLHDLGKMLMWQAQLLDYEKLIKDNLQFDDVIHLKEREAYGYDHAVLAAHLLKYWQIPEPIPSVIAWHHQPSRVYRQGGLIANLVSLVRIADRMSYSLGRRAEEDKNKITQICKDEAASLLNLSEEQLTEYWDDLHVVMSESSLF
ncbi:MAG: HDOD domain-containing protein [Pseudomonadota bacterium]